MVYPPEEYVSSKCANTGKPNTALDQECKEFTGKDQLNALVAELNDTNNPLPILCEHEANTVAGRVKCAKLTPGRGILVTMSLDTSTEHGRRAADKVASGEWAYVSLGHEFLATRKVGGKSGDGDHGYNVKKTAREVSCCALGARNQTAIIERLDESKWEQHATQSGIVMSSATAACCNGNSIDHGSGDGAIGIDKSNTRGDAKVQKEGYSFRNVLIGEVLASSVSDPSSAHSKEVEMAQENNAQQEPNAEAPSPAPAQEAPSLNAEAAVASSVNQVDGNNAPDAPVTTEKSDAAPANPKDGAQGNEEKQEDILETLAKADQELGRLSEQNKEYSEKMKELSEKVKMHEENERKREVEAAERRKEEISKKRTQLEGRLKTLQEANTSVGMVNASVILSENMDIDQSEHIVSALEKATEGYIAASDSKKQLQQQLTDMSSAVGIAAEAQREGGSANKRKAEDIIDPAVLAAEGTVNASANGAQDDMVNGLPRHTADFMSGKISYDELSRTCEAIRDEESGRRVSNLRGSVKASADCGSSVAAPTLGLGITGGFSASAHTAYTQYVNSNSQRLLPPPHEMRQDCAGMGLKQLFPGVWDEFMQINNSFQKTGVPAYVKGAIMASLNTYEHKRRNGESRLEINDQMPPAPGGHIRSRQVREMER